MAKYKISEKISGYYGNSGKKYIAGQEVSEGEIVDVKSSLARGIIEEVKQPAKTEPKKAK